MVVELTLYLGMGLAVLLIWDEVSGIEETSTESSIIYSLLHSL